MWNKIKNAAVSVWDYLDGKKTAIGTGCLIIANYIPEDKTAHIVLKIVGELFGGSGVIHKLSKANKLSGVDNKFKVFLNKLTDRKQ